MHLLSDGYFAFSLNHNSLWKISRIDYCNSILYRLPTVEHEKLQRVQNTAAHLITGSSRKDHITPVLKNLHWLPVKLRITFKILLLTYKILNGQSPSHLTSLISSYKPLRSLRSSNHSLLKVPNVMTTTYRQRTFSYCAPKLWNSLPKSLVWDWDCLRVWDCDYL